MSTKQKQRKSAKKKVRILIVDDHPIVRQGLAGLINHEPDLNVCAGADDAQQAIKVIRDQRPDMAIVDISLRGISGIELIKDIRVRFPRLPVLVLSMHDESLYAERALRAGARGYIMKAEATEKMVTAVRKVLSGELYLSDKMSGKMLHKLVGGRIQPGIRPIETLSDRELEVFTLIGRGHTTRQIAEEFHLSVKTIDSYRAHIKEKLNLANATELIQHAIRWQNSENKV